MRISDWSSDVCSSDLRPAAWLHPARPPPGPELASRPAPPPAISSIRALSSSRLLRDSWLQEEQEHPASRHDACADCCAQTGIGEACIEQDRKSVGKGKSVSVRVALGGGRIIKKKNKQHK